MKFLNKDTIRLNNQAAKKQLTRQYSMPNAPMGEMSFTQTGEESSKIFTQEMLDHVASLPKGEMMSMQEVRAFIEQSTLDITKAFEEHPALYTEVYEVIKNGDFSDTVKVQDVIGLQAAFSAIHDGESVALASYKVKKSEIVNILTFAVGYSITSDWLAYNQSWKIGQANKALGNAYSAILDHIHFLPIIKGNYSGTSETKKVSTGKTELETVWLTLRKGIQDALKRTSIHGYKLRPTVALCNSATAMDVEAAVNGLLQNGSQLGSLGVITKVIAYDGWEGEVNGAKHTFEAPKDNEVYLIQPKQAFKSLVKTDITELKQRGNVLTLSELDVAQFFRCGVLADVTNSVHKVTLG